MIGKTNAIGGVSEPVPKIRTVSGSVISISNALALPAVALIADVNAVQNLNGYDNPWPAGGGKNKLNFSDFSTYSSWKTDIAEYGTYPTISANKGYKLDVTAGVQYTVSFGISASSFPTYLYFCHGDGTETYRDYRFTSTSYIGTSYTFTAVAGDVYYIRMGSTSNETNFNTQIAKVSDGQLEIGSTATAFAPYANICPISGWSNVNVYREAQYDAGATPYATINLNGTVYGGSLNVTTGALTVTHGYIASYSGESLPSSWISDRDMYVVGTTPTAGAEVVYELATPQTVQLTPTEVQMLLGNNVLWSDSGDIELQYWARR